MTRNLSVFLDLLRLVAALLVVVAHACEIYHMQLPDLFAHSAKEGVAVFFVLSGFVIAFVTTSREQDWKTFAKARMLRMYSVVPVAVIVLVACHRIGSTIDPVLYSPAANSPGGIGGAAFGVPPNWLVVARYLTFTNEVWFDRVVIVTGAPFWSLGFEVAYYVAFAIMLYVRGTSRWVLAAIWMSACGPRIAIAFPLWLIGVGTWKVVQRKWPLGLLPGMLSLVGIVAAAVVWRRWAAAMAIPLFDWAPPVPLAASMGYYLVTAVLVGAAIVVFAASTQERALWSTPVAAVIRYCAGRSFTLYVAHVPVLVLVAAAWPASRQSLVSGLGATVFSIAITFILAEFGERRKTFYAKAFAVILPIKINVKS